MTPGYKAKRKRERKRDKQKKEAAACENNSKRGEGYRGGGERQ